MAGKNHVKPFTLSFWGKRIIKFDEEGIHRMIAEGLCFGHVMFCIVHGVFSCK
jgi:hypothetical protein